jgi:hypothetical protein
MTGKILVGAMVMGMVMLVVVSAYLIDQKQFHTQPQAMLLYAALGLWPACALVAMLMGGVLRKQAGTAWREGSSGDTEALAPKYLVMTIVRAALMEGPGLFGAVVFLLTGEVIALSVTALSLVGLALLFPTEDRYQAFVRDVTSA